jgi:hypothetical protein
MSDDWYLAWIEQRRAAAPPEEMPDRVMQLVMIPTREQEVVALRIASWIERSRVARCAACAAAMLIGSTPFVAYFAFLMSV